MAATDDQERIEVAAGKVLALLIDKAPKTNAPDTALVIAIDDISICRHQAWSSLIAAIEARGGVSHGTFRWVFILNRANNELQQVAWPPPWSARGMLTRAYNSTLKQAGLE